MMPKPPGVTTADFGRWRSQIYTLRCIETNPQARQALQDLLDEYKAGTLKLPVGTEREHRQTLDKNFPTIASRRRKGGR